MSCINSLTQILKNLVVDSLRTSIETTGYAILSLLASGGEENVMLAISAAKWLSLHRNTNGGFISTQVFK